ncbi:MAG: rane protein [Miltoncostaeaceae bacterium]|jgi:membrane protein|nr:rane protein [Miltoncostaeaceae bacterium]
MGTRQQDRRIENTQAEMERRRRAAPEWRARARGEGGEANGAAAAEPDPDRAPAGRDAAQLTPQPERDEPKLADPGLTDLSRADYAAVVKRTVKSAMRDQVTDLAAALAYYSFMAIPAALLVAVGIFGLVLSPNDITTLVEKLSSVVPQGAQKMLLDLKPGSAGALIGVGTLLALWSTTGAMTAFMRALNRAYGREETRSFVRQRLVALAMVGIMGLAFVLVMVLLILGPAISSAIGDATGMPGAFKAIWWLAQWPILFFGLVAAFSTLLYLGPNVDHPRWRFLTPGAVVAALLWIAASGLFAVYTSMFSSYGGAWGPLAGVIVFLTWLWLTGIALLFGAELNAELERSRELRRGEPAERDLQVPARA